MTTRFLLICLAASVGFAQDSWMTKGVDAYRHARHAEAIQCFEHAAIDDPQSATVRLSLALAYLATYIPGAESRENRSMGRDAEENLRAALEIDPQSTIAILYLAEFYYSEAYGEPSAKKDERLNQAQQLFQKLAQINPKSKEAFYALGVIAWQKSSHRLEDATKQFSHALQLDPGYEDAMDYLALIQREKGDEAAADEWSAKARKHRQAKEEKWRAAHPKSNSEKPCPPDTMCFDPDPASHDTLPLEWPPTPIVWMPPPPPPPPPAPVR
jgi:tetratricopeptide (TPR) repeat protein